jgi:hypothetical protein
MMSEDQDIAADQTGWEAAQDYFREASAVQTPPTGQLIIRKSDVQIRTLADWRLYASPRGGEAQWRDYRSAKELARAWCPDGIGPTIPPETRALLSTRPEFSGFELVEALPDCRVRVDDLPGEPPNADLMLVGTTDSGTAEFVMGVIAKGDEPFGAYVSDELVAAARRVAREVPATSFERITRLAGALLPARVGGEPHLGELRYQLLTATAGAVAYATERGAKRAVVMVHEFRTHETDDSLLMDNQRDLDRLMQRITNSETTAVPINQLIGPVTIPGNEFISPDVELFVGKVRRELLALDF